MLQLPDYPLFYLPAVTTLGPATVTDDEAAHAIRVLRMREGEQVLVTNGRGGLFEARVTAVGKRELTVEVEKSIDVPASPRRLHIAIAPTKNIDRIEWFLEKATETGIAEITPIICRRSERKEVRIDRLEKIIVAAAKQSRHASFPVLNNPMTYADFLKSTAGPGRYIAHCHAGEKPLLIQALGTNNSALILIGPEGDFHEDEVKSAIDAGFQSVSLGESRFRTETAALMACFMFEVKGGLIS